MFYDNVDSYESICSFLLHKITLKKIIPIKLEIWSDNEDYVNEYLLAIKNVNDEKYHMLTHRNSKFLSYNLLFE